jgi:hypothetical protein
LCKNFLIDYLSIKDINGHFLTKNRGFCQKERALPGRVGASLATASSMIPAERGKNAELLGPARHRQKKIPRRFARSKNCPILAVPLQR